MQQFLLLEKALNLVVLLHLQVSLVAQLLSQVAVNLVVQSHQPAAAASLVVADAAILANQLNVITVRMEYHPAFFCRIFGRVTANASEPNP